MKQNESLKIGTFSILCYLIFKLSLYILINSLLLLNLKLQISNEIILLSSFGIISVVIPIIVLMIALNNRILKSITPTFKNICYLFLLLVIMTFAIEGDTLNLSQHMSVLEQGEFRSSFLNQYSWSKGILYLFFSITILIFILRKLSTLEKKNYVHKSEFFKIGTSSVLSYLIFEKTYVIMTSILTWIYTLLKIENEFIILSINILFGFMSILILISIYNQIIKNKVPSKKNIYILLSVVIILGLLFNGNKMFLFPEYMVNQTDLDSSDFKFLFQFSWSKSLNYSVRLLGLTYFVWKIYFERKTVANNS